MRIGVFYHCLLSAVHRPIEAEYATNMVVEQLSAMDISGLTDAANEMFVFVNGTPGEAYIVASVCPNKAIVVTNENANSEIPTLVEVRKWATANPDSAILYHHTKGVSTPRMADNWRKRMEQFLVWDWKACVDRLAAGYEAVGCHWLTPEQNPGSITSPFFGGNFWWARSEYVERLPLLPPDTWENRYEAESWIGRGQPRPKILDLSPGWPTL